MFPKGAFVVVCYVFTFAVDIFEGIGAWFALSIFEPGGIELGISLIVPCYISMVLQLIRSIALLTF